MTAFERATGYIGIRRRTVAEIRRYLVGKGYSLKEIAETVDKLLEYGYLNDAEFAAEYVDAYRHRGGVMKLRAGLIRAGADREAIAEALEDLGGQLEEAEACAHRYLRGKDTDNPQLKQKLARHLAGKGFLWDTVKKVCEKVLKDVEEEND